MKAVTSLNIAVGFPHTVCLTHTHTTDKLAIQVIPSVTWDDVGYLPNSVEI